MNKFNISEECREEIDVKTALFYFNQAEKKLDSLIETSYKTTERAYMLLTGMIAIISIVTSVLSNINHIGILIKISMSIIIVVAVACIYILLRYIIKSRSTSMPGRDPINLQIEKNASYYWDKHKALYKNTLLDELTILQEKIVRDTNSISSRTKKFDLCVKMIACSISITGFLVVISFWVNI